MLFATCPSDSFTTQLMTQGCIVVLSIIKSVEPNNEQKVLAGSFDQEFTVNTRQVSRGFRYSKEIKCKYIKESSNNCSEWPNPF